MRSRANPKRGKIVVPSDVKMKILVTGCLGYIGSQLGASLKKRFENFEILGIDTGLFVMPHNY